jgi:ABC-type phosphate transport system substrate-binding protein
MIARSLKQFIGVFAFCFSVAISAEERPFVVVNSQVYPTTNLSRNTLCGIFGMRIKKWEDGSIIKVFVLPDNHPLHIEFSKNILRVFPYQLRNAWDRLVFSGTGEEPTQVSTEQQMRARVSSTRGAIGYLSRSMIDETIKAVPFE